MILGLWVLACIFIAAAVRPRKTVVHVEVKSESFSEAAKRAGFDPDSLPTCREAWTRFPEDRALIRRSLEDWEREQTKIVAARMEADRRAVEFLIESTKEKP